MLRYLWLLPALLLALPLAAQANGRAASGSSPEMARIPAGSYVPLYTVNGEPVRVAAFELDRRPVTRADYLEFVRENPRWRRSEIPPIFAGAGYLADWAGDLDFGSKAGARRPATQVSWFAAKAYCEAQGKRLPTVDEWEYTAGASETRADAARDPAFITRLLSLYTGPKPRHAEVGSTFANLYGVHDLHGLVWEWTLDFNMVVVSDDSRGATSHDRQLYCAAGAIGTTDPNNYPAFLRYAFRSGLNARSTVGNLGFRCARSIEP